VPPNPPPAAAQASAGGGLSKGPPPPLPSKPAALVQTKVVVALHAYKADADGELTMEKGDEITVTDEGDNSGWWKGDSPVPLPSFPCCPFTPLRYLLAPHSFSLLLRFYLTHISFRKLTEGHFDTRYETDFKCGGN
jgi:hypothetical protein